MAIRQEPEKEPVKEHAREDAVRELIGKAHVKDDKKEEVVLERAAESRRGTPFNPTMDQLARIDRLMKVSGMDSQQQQKFFPQLLAIINE